ncbi:hypothetical protein CEXT_616411 [Caerostris extrusa]|uniref:Uncharacterized protein n=1 Tax=Caerostris extrusa TaxID=172846 RepID=A0AAV4SUC8_CAEEX|nr:hypothetical protein CEXT_616411 [Caerostris extrusa]
MYQYGRNGRLWYGRNNRRLYRYMVEMDVCIGRNGRLYRYGMVEFVIWEMGVCIGMVEMDVCIGMVEMGVCIGMVEMGVCIVTVSLIRILFGKFNKSYQQNLRSICIPLVDVILKGSSSSQQSATISVVVKYELSSGVVWSGGRP